jgi:ammonium transporter, Amt family
LEINSGDTAWVLASTALVILMTPALGFFYGGLVRKKNVLSTIMHSFFILCLISVVWTLWGFTLAFGEGNRFIGNLDFIGLRDITGDPLPNAPTIPGAAFVMFQGAFAIITPALITGAFAERKRFKAFVIFSLLWSTLVYSPLAHWVWAPTGWIFKMGALDFAGGTVVHISSGVSALVAALVIGKRVGFGKEEMEPHDLTMTVLGAGLLWFGWFGFNAGSALGANGLAATAFLVTNISAAMGALTWMTVSWIKHGHPSVLGAAAGAVAGLVAITPAAGYVSPSSAIVIGFGGGFFCFFALEILKERLRVDDALDVFAVHGIGGIWGALATGLFAELKWNSAGNDGLFFGNAELFGKQIIAVGAAIALAGIGSFILLKIVDLVVGLRVPEQEEVLGLDPSQHGELAYQL